MATTYTRRINLYINGKEVKNDIASIKGAMAKLINEQARMTLGSKEYYAHAAKIKQLKGIMQEHQRSLNDTQKSWMSLNKMADAFNKYQSLFLGFVGSLAGVVLSVKSAVNAYAMFEDKLADVIKTTGLTKEQVIKLNDELKKIDTRSSQEDLLNLARVAGKLGITAEDEILGFVRAADQIRVALTEDLGGDVEDSINQLGKLVDIFKLKDQFGIEQSLLKVGSAINSLGAAGTANEGYMVEFSKRVAGIAPGAGISIQNILGLGATLDELGQTAEVSGTVFSQVITGMFKDVPTYAKMAGMSVGDFNKLLSQDANEAFIKVLEGARSSGEGFGAMAKSLDGLGLDGARATAVIGVLADNTAKMREKQALANKEFAAGISLTNEFNTKNKTAQAELEKAKEKFAELSVELGKKLTPAYTAVISKARLMIELISTLADFFTKHGRAIATVITTIVAYTAVVKIMALWEARKNKEIGIGLVLSKLQLFWTNAIKGATLLAAAAQALLTGNITRASAAMRVFNTVTKLSPIGILVSLLTTAVTAFFLFKNKAEDATKSQKKFNDEIKRGNDLQNQNKTLEERLSVMKLLSKEQLSTLKGDIETQLSYEDDFHATLLSKLKTALEEDQTLRELNERATQKGLTEIQKINLAAQVNARKEAIARDLEEENKGNKKRLNSLKNHLQNVNKELSVRPKDPGTDNGDPDGGGDLTKERKEQLEKFNEFLEKQADEQYEAFMEYFHKAGADGFDAFINAFEEKAREKDIINDALKSQKEEQPNDPAFDYALQKFAETEQGKINILNAQHKSGIIGEKEYQDKLSAIHKEAEDDREATREQNMEKAQQVTAMASNFVSAMMDFELEKAGDNEEKKAQIRKKYAGIQFATTAAQIIIDTAAAVMKALAQLGPIAGPIAAALMSATGVAQLAIANEQRKKMASGDGYAEGGFTGSGKENEPAGIVHGGEFVASAPAVQNPTIRPVLDIIDQAQRSGTVANVNLDEQLGEPAQPAPGDQKENANPGQKLVTARILVPGTVDSPAGESMGSIPAVEKQNNEPLGLQHPDVVEIPGESVSHSAATDPGQKLVTAGILVPGTVDSPDGESMGSIPAVENETAEPSILKIPTGNLDEGFSAGGFTSPGKTEEPAGIVHKGEWVAPNWLLSNPHTKMIINSLEQIRRHKVNINPSLVTGKIPFATGGYSATPNVSSNDVSLADAELKELIRKNIEVNERMLQWKPKVYTELIKKDLETLERIDRNRSL